MFNLKLGGIIAIIGGFGYLGLTSAWLIRKRAEELKNLRIAMGILEKEITCFFTPLTLALSRCAPLVQFPANIFFQHTASALKQRKGITAFEAWQAGINSLAEVSAFKSEDVKLIDSLVNQLGMGDIDDQKKAFLRIDQELKLQEEKVRSKFYSEGKMLSYGGFLLGITVTILLI